MAQIKESATKSLYVSLFVVGLFLAAIIVMQTPQNSNSFSLVTNVYAGDQEPIEFTATPSATVRATVTVKPTATPRATATASATPAPTVFVPQTTETPQSPTPVPTFNLDLPGDTTPVQTPVPTPYAGATQNNMPIIIAAVIGGLLLVGGLILFFVRRNKNSDYNPPSGGMPPAPPFQQPQGQTGQQNSGSFSTPYDQYISNQPNKPNEQ